MKRLVLGTLVLVVLALVVPVPAFADDASSVGEMGTVTVIDAERGAYLTSSVAAGMLVVRTVVLNAPDGVTPEDFVARLTGPEGIVDVPGSGEGTVLAPVSPGQYALVGVQGPADLAYMTSSNSPVLVPEGGQATLVITNAIPATSSISTGPTTTLKTATTVPDTIIPVPTIVHAGGGGVQVEHVAGGAAGGVRVLVLLALFAMALVGVATIMVVTVSERVVLRRR